MKINKIEVNITFFIISLGMFLLNFHNFSFISLLFGFILAALMIKLSDKTNLYNYKITKFILFLLTIIIQPIYLNKITYFISSNILRNYSGIVISLLLIITCLLITKKGYHTIIKIILLSSYFFVTLLIISIFLSSFYLEIENYSTNLLTNNIFSNSIFYAIMLTYIYFIIYGPSNAKISFKFLLINFLYQLFTYLFIIGILGTTLTNLYEFPFIIIFKKINILDFIERIEFIFSLNYLFSFYYFLIISFYQIKSFIDKKKKYSNIFLLLITILIYIISLLIT